MTTLLHERGTLGLRADRAVRAAAAPAGDPGEDARARTAPGRPTTPWYATGWARSHRPGGAAVHQLPGDHALQRTGVPGPEGSIAKLHWSEANQRLTALAQEVLGARRAARRRLLGLPAAALAREHDRGRDVGDPAQHRRRAGRRPAQVAVRRGGTMDVTLSERPARSCRVRPAGCFAERDWLPAAAPQRWPTPPTPRTPYDAKLWDELVGLGWVGLSSPDEGGGFLDEAVLLEEAGYALAPVPLLSAAIAAPAAVGRRAADAAGRAVAWAEPVGATAVAPSPSDPRPAGARGDSSARAGTADRHEDRRRRPAAGRAPGGAGGAGGTAGRRHVVTWPPQPAACASRARRPLDGTRRVAHRRARRRVRGRRRGDPGQLRRGAAAGFAARGRSRSGWPSVRSTSPPRTRRRASSSADRSGPTRPCRTASPTSTSHPSWPGRWRTGPPGTSPRPSGGRRGAPTTDVACSAAKAAAGEAAVFARSRWSRSSAGWA